MGSSQSSTTNNGAAVPNGGSKIDGCPVDHSKMGKQEQGGCPVDHSKMGKQEQGGCPVNHDGKQQYNVYAQPIDPKNQMPFNPNQLPSPGQKSELSTERVQSGIPKGGADDETWAYPSPQMFYNALVRKGKGEDVDEKEVETIVAVHNNMNERAWNLVVNWEKAMHKEEFEKANGIRLSRFMGRPDDISPMAWFKHLVMGYPKPFDRHDWIIDRDGKEVRYIIDFYYFEDKAKKDEKPALHDVRSIQSIKMDARPAVDSIESVIDRIKYPVLEKLDMLKTEEITKTNIPKTKEKVATAEDNSVTTFDKMNIENVRDYSQQIGAKCQPYFEKLNQCTSESECQKASMGLTYCMASLVCPPEAQRYTNDIKDEGKLDQMVDCMNRFEQAALNLRQQQQQQ